MTSTDLSSWSALWRELGAVGDPEPWHARLVATYGEPSRAYHNLQHIAECLAELAAVRTLAREPALIAAALWFHDAVYDPRSATNEEDSARLADECFAGAGLAEGCRAAVRRLILCTKTHESGGDPDTALLVDIDLAILGQRAERFWDYERGIRAEYAWVSAAIYAEKRSDILARFLQRPAIYRTPVFAGKYEAAARANLEAAIERLRKSCAE